jgi:pyrimidine-nucleoside phosphorylase
MAAVVSDMSQPLGRSIGNALEVAEAMDTLEGSGPPELTAFALDLAALIVELASEGAQGRAEVERALQSGAARGVFRRMVVAQGGDAGAFDDRARLPAARVQHMLVAEEDGYVSRLDALTVARASTELGAGRERKGDALDLSVGVVLEVKLGDRVEHGQPLATLHANDEGRAELAEWTLRSGIALSHERVPPPPLILERISD